MKKVEVIFKTPSGNESVQRINANDSDSMKRCEYLLAKSLPSTWVVVRSRVVKQW